MKRETGGNPVRSRHCDREFSAGVCHCDSSIYREKAAGSDDLKSGDLLIWVD